MIRELARCSSQLSVTRDRRVDSGPGIDAAGDVVDLGEAECAEVFRGLAAVLLAALIGPGFVDWRGYRPQIEARLASALGVETSIAR